MARGNVVILEQDQANFARILGRLLREANAKLVFLLDKSGQQIASSGEVNGVDATALASLAAGNVAATEGLAQLIGEDEFSTLFHEGASDSLHINLVADRFILLVIFDEHSSLGLVRLRVKQRVDELTEVIGDMMKRDEEDRAAPAGAASSSIGEITDEDIDALFG